MPPKLPDFEQCIDAVSPLVEPVKAAEALVAHGEYLRNGLQRILAKNGIQSDVIGLAPVPIIVFAEEKPLVVKTLFTQEMLKRGYLASNVIYVSTQHARRLCDRYL